jgi:hypothetical protein
MVRVGVDVQKGPLTRAYVALRCRRGDFDGDSVGSNPQQPTISRTPRPVGGDRPSTDGHVGSSRQRRQYPSHRYGPRRSPSPRSDRCRSRSSTNLWLPVPSRTLPHRAETRQHTTDGSVNVVSYLTALAETPHRQRGRCRAQGPSPRHPRNVHSSLPGRAEQKVQASSIDVGWSCEVDGDRQRMVSPAG